MNACTIILIFNIAFFALSGGLRFKILTQSHHCHAEKILTFAQI